jgi:hypothetical protein
MGFIVGSIVPGTLQPLAILRVFPSEEFLNERIHPNVCCPIQIPEIDVRGTRNTEDSIAAVAAAATGDGVVALNLISVLIQVAEEREDAVAGIKFEGDGVADNVAAGGKRSRLDGSRTEAGRVEGDGSADLEAARRAGTAALTNIACHVERPLRGTGEAATQIIGDIRNVDAGDVFLRRRWHSHR